MIGLRLGHQADPDPGNVDLGRPRPGADKTNRLSMENEYTK